MCVRARVRARDERCRNKTWLHNFLCVTHPFTQHWGGDSGGGGGGGGGRCPTPSSTPDVMCCLVFAQPLLRCLIGH